jgi:predicted 3-demethylubiquinone-9 3-methyltransferase (glyoxalase superfamily)
MNKLMTCIWFDHGQALEAANFYASTFPNSTDDQEQTDYYWNAIVSNSGSESACGWCKDKWGISWQITPKRLLELTTSKNQAIAKRAFDAMMMMKKINIAEIEQAIQN